VPAKRRCNTRIYCSFHGKTSQIYGKGRKVYRAPGKCAGWGIIYFGSLFSTKPFKLVLCASSRQSISSTAGPEQRPRQWPFPPPHRRPSMASDPWIT
jgi:hypothetical protein